ncbi:alpha/beta hydrolase [Desulfocarbo indianensis]|nr:alpha/beta hydrolase [Desulfocarbo indianensis]
MAWDSFIESQIFFPERRLESQPGDWGLPHEEQWIVGEEGVRLHAWWLPAPEARTVLLFFHGNAGNISHRLDNLRRLHAWGLSVLIFDYRGYGKSQGKISEPGFYADSRAALAAGLARAQATGCRLVLFGRSLGGAAAVSVAAEPRVAGVILESTFTNLGDMAKVHFPLPGLGRLGSRFNSLGRIAEVRAPKLFIHGDRDDIVPWELGRRLYEAAPDPKSWLSLPGAGHNDTYLVGGDGYFRAIREFLDSLPAPGVY